MNNSEPIGRFGTEWQKFMKENYPDIITAELVGEKFNELARKIDAEAISQQEQGCSWLASLYVLTVNHASFQR